MNSQLEHIINRANELFSEMVAMRRHLHQNPELSYEEYKTSDFIKNKLSLLGIPNQKLANTGVVGLIGKGDKCVALRADIDALPILEANSIEYCSINNGVMHACGHDLHTSMLLGAAQILKEFEPYFEGTVKLIFQPGEEKLPGGAIEMINQGVLENPVPLAVFGQHCNPETSTGTISLKSGPIMAATDELYWTIVGKSTHAAQPHLGTDPILASSHLIVHLQSMLTKFRNPLEPGILTVSSIHGGTSNNIIPDNVDMKGTLRSFDENWRNKALIKSRKISQDVCGLFDTHCVYNCVPGYPVLVNNVETTDFISNLFVKMFGEANLIDLEPKMWAEDFSYFAQKIPSTFWFLGVKPIDKDMIPPLHNAQFSPDEKSMIYGASMLAASALMFLERVK